ncbi:hypothetical protein BN59_03556 [Legionella massiliensis]|uniref:Uncharacterized protein n=1 Tax=Legionella massiliensis TaxID=1034943 RepID=A0A078L5M3_9GAMM|nr:hypothetical protein [Legionella massiliensis]CDZ79238.1 hypothetical protein BN59_03556 [Legionella massiliensis]CEE14976.1 hypothetical protein BN1094_03556 [Legionella massiliensis]
MNNQCDATHLGENIIPGRRICWSAIFAGAFTGLGLGFLLQLYGIAIGLSAYSSSSSGGAVIAIGGFLGMLVGIIASMIAAGFVAGHLGRSCYSHCHDGVIYGFLTWSLALVLSAILLFPLTYYTSAYTKALSPTVEVTNTLPHSIAIKSDANSTQGTMKTYPNIKTTPTALTGSSWILFLLFFIGAISSCVGACWGASCKQECPAKSDKTPSSPTLR